MIWNRKKQRERYEFVIAIPDTHAPYVDREAFGAVLKFMKQTKPDRVVWLGDHCDFYQVSRFDKDPNRANQLQADVDAAHSTLKEGRNAAPNALMEYTGGNHERRMRKYVWGPACALASLRCLDVPELLRLAELGIRYHETGKLQIGDVLFKHGTTVRKKSGATAMAELERHWLSGVSGHTHRLAEVYRRNTSGYYKWVEAGCLCDLSPEYADGEDFDWQHGIVWGWLERGGNRFSVHTSPVVNGRIIYGGQEIGG